MLESPQVQKLMKSVAAGIFPSQLLLDVHSEPTSDLDGKEALQITLLLSDGAAETLTGKQLSNLLNEFHNSLQRAGDERFPFFKFQTPTDRGEDDEED
jgi:hypothetical protein